MIGSHHPVTGVQGTENLLDQDPRFVDAAKGNFPLRADSPAYKLGFQRLPFEQIGLSCNPR